MFLSHVPPLPIFDNPQNDMLSREQEWQRLSIITIDQRKCDHNKCAQKAIHNPKSGTVRLKNRSARDIR
jgi:hypothetical protein